MLPPTPVHQLEGYVFRECREPGAPPKLVSGRAVLRSIHGGFGFRILQQLEANPIHAFGVVLEHRRDLSRKHAEGLRDESDLPKAGDLGVGFRISV